MASEYGLLRQLIVEYRCCFERASTLMGPCRTSMAAGNPGSGEIQASAKSTVPEAARRNRRLRFRKVYIELSFNRVQRLIA